MGSSPPRDFEHPYDDITECKKLEIMRLES
jgi:hypothetical protein